MITCTLFDSSGSLRTRGNLTSGFSVSCVVPVVVFWVDLFPPVCPSGGSDAYPSLSTSTHKSVKVLVCVSMSVFIHPGPRYGYASPFRRLCVDTVGDPWGGVRVTGAHPHLKEGRRVRDCHLDTGIVMVGEHRCRPPRGRRPQRIGVFSLRQGSFTAGRRPTRPVTGGDGSGGLDDVTPHQCRPGGGAGGTGRSHPCVRQNRRPPSAPVSSLSPVLL